MYFALDDSIKNCDPNHNDLEKGYVTGVCIFVICIMVTAYKNVGTILREIYILLRNKTRDNPRKNGFERKILLICTAYISFGLLDGGPRAPPSAGGVDQQIKE